MNEEGVQQLPSHVAIYCFISGGWKREGSVLQIHFVQPADCNYACAQTTITNCYGSMTHAIVNRLRRFTINMIKVCKKKSWGWRQRAADHRRQGCEHSMK